MTFSTVLVANRGEIAVRVMRTCRERGITTVAVHSFVDADALHVREADRAVALPGAPVAAYLDIDAVIAAAVDTGADAVHPGYGFLSEHPDMPAACADAGITFIGPNADVIRLMGDKAASKEAAAAAGVPVLASFDPADRSEQELHAAVTEMGLPIIVKAVSGGGGKGMRRVDAIDDLVAAVAAAAREGAAAFGDDRLLIEPFVTAPRHVEIQVAGDSHGGAVHLFERDCSIQRRHQKIVEEAPSPALDSELRARMGAAAVALVQQVGYTNLGTVEFLLDTTSDGTAFHFLEMNTRLQVEHPVTELVTGLDLVGCQLDIADGGRVPTPPASPQGHAIEVRLYAEDVEAGFLPQVGTLVDFDIPAGVRVDSGVTAGSLVSSHYDPMLAKVIAHGPDRETARTTLLRALDDAAVTGVVTNLDHLRTILAEPAFRDGAFTTAFLTDHLPAWQPDALDATTVAAAMAAMAGPRGSASEVGASSTPADPWQALGPWRASGTGGWSLDWPDIGRATATTTATATQVTFDIDDVSMRVVPSSSMVGQPGTVGRGAGPSTGPGTGTGVDTDNGLGTGTGLGTGPRRLTDAHDLVVDGQPVTIGAWRDGDHVWVARRGHGSQRVHVPSVIGHRDASLVAGDATLTAPMPGQVLDVAVAAGDTVTAGQTLVTVEAMKMEHPVTAPGNASVSEVRVTPGQAVVADEVLVVLHAHDDEAASGSDGGADADAVADE